MENITFKGQTQQFANSLKIIIMSKEKVKEFEELVRPILKYLCENYHPHVTVIITPTTAELVEGQMSIGQVLDYVLD
jgi:ABC-type phosphate/phosphonate transport system substrate-binding protein